MANPYAQNGQYIGTSWDSLSSLGKYNMITSGISAIGGMVTSYIGAKTANIVAKAQQQMAEENAKMEELKANAALNAANIQVSQITMKYGQMKSRQKTAFAANGIKLSGGGTVAEVLTTTDTFKEMDAHQAYMNGMNAAWGYLSKASAYKNQATAAKYSRVSTGFVAAGSLLKGLGGMATAYVNMAGYNNIDAMNKDELTKFTEYEARERSDAAQALWARLAFK